MESVISRSPIENESAAFLLGQISSGKSFDNIESADIIKSLFDIKKDDMSAMDITNALANSMPSQQQDEIRSLLQNESAYGPIWWFTTTKHFLISFAKEISSKGNYLSLTLMVRESDGISIQVRKLVEFNKDRVTFMDRRLRSTEFSPVVCDALETIHNNAIASLEKKLLEPEAPKPQEPAVVDPSKFEVTYKISTDINPFKIRRLERLFRKHAIVDFEHKTITNLDEINDIIGDTPGLGRATTKIVSCEEFGTGGRFVFTINVMQYVEPDEEPVPAKVEEPKVEEPKAEEPKQEKVSEPEPEDNRPLFSTEFKFLGEDDGFVPIDNTDEIILRTKSALDKVIPDNDGDVLAISNHLNDPETFQDDGSVLNYIVTWSENFDTKMGEFIITISRIYPDFTKVKNINILRKIYKEFAILHDHITQFNQKFAELNEPSIVSAKLSAFDNAFEGIDKDAIEILKTNFKELYDTYMDNHHRVEEWLVAVNEHKDTPQDIEDRESTEEQSEPSTNNEETMEKNEEVETPVDTTIDADPNPQYEVVVDASLADIYETIVHAFNELYGKSGILDIDQRLSEMIEMDLYVEAVDPTHFVIHEKKVDETPGADIHDVNVQHGLLRGIFGVIDPAVTHVQKFLHKHLTEEQNPGYLSTGTYPTETMIVWNEKPYNFTMSIIKFKNGRYYRIYLAVTDPSLDDPSWLATRHMSGRWIQIGRDVQSNEFTPSFQGRRPRYN